jgi:hypothetical protein
VGIIHGIVNMNAERGDVIEAKQETPADRQNMQIKTLYERCEVI